MSEDCCICNVEFETKEKNFVALACGHKYHAECIFEWFKRAPTCPYCFQQQNVKLANNSSWDKEIRLSHKIFQHTQIVNNMYNKSCSRFHTAFIIGCCATGLLLNAKRENMQFGAYIVAQTAIMFNLGELISFGYALKREATLFSHEIDRIML